jgi:hypothetical protein
MRSAQACAPVGSRHFTAGLQSGGCCWAALRLCTKMMVHNGNAHCSADGRRPWYAPKWWPAQQLRYGRKSASGRSTPFSGVCRGPRPTERRTGFVQVVGLGFVFQSAVEEPECERSSARYRLASSAHWFLVVAAAMVRQALARAAARGRAATCVGAWTQLWRSLGQQRHAPASCQFATAASTAPPAARNERAQQLFAIRTSGAWCARHCVGSSQRMSLLVVAGRAGSGPDLGHAPGLVSDIGAH